MKVATAFLLLATANAVTAADVSELNWMSGCWAYDGRERGSGEYWMPAAGDMMIAVSRTVREGKTVAFEYLRIMQTEEGSIALFAAPSGQEPARFDMIDFSGTRVVFENPEHDFPQRIIYELTDPTHLLGRIEGNNSGEEMTIDFSMTRISCDEFAE